ncbi:restriction endonuclease subunit S [Sedimentibacter saalensis]|uniref:restriction endonuclease subunit S n=1 Tax=Sedimentibacter saalensis TaxID=130788 RepID=UPI00289A28EC|nr:restriction endonuclease subunit S [Sedimentibacter saalensis]
MSKLEELIEELCPNGVQYISLFELADIGTGSSNTNEEVIDGKYPFFVRSQEVRTKNEYEFDEEAIITSGDGVGVGKIFHYVNGKYALHQRAYRIHFRDNRIIPRFFLHYMKATFFQYISKSAVNSSVKSVRRPMMNKYPVPVPPLPVQSEIVRILDNFKELITELTTELTAEFTARKKQYDHYRDNLLNYIENEVKLDDIAKFTYGYTDKAKEHGNVRFIRITDINSDGYLKNEDTKYLELNDENKKFLVKTGDLLMARTGATYGKTLYVIDEKPAIYASFLIKIELNNDVMLNRFYWHFSKSNLYWNQANKLVTTGGQPQFNANALKQIIIPVPSLDEQERIVAILDRFDALCNDITTGLFAEIEARTKQYEYYRDKLLTFKELS